MRPEQREDKAAQSTSSIERVTGIVLLRGDGAVLLQHRDDKPGLHRAGLWVPPGGHCEPGESMEACARREFLEETAYECGELHWLASFQENLDVELSHSQQATMFWGQYDGIQSVQCLEGQALEFVERKIAPSYRMPPYVVELWDLAIAASTKGKG